MMKQRLNHRGGEPQRKGGPQNKPKLNAAATCPGGGDKFGAKRFVGAAEREKRTKNLRRRFGAFGWGARLTGEGGG